MNDCIYTHAEKDINRRNMAAIKEFVLGAIMRLRLAVALSVDSPD